MPVMTCLKNASFTAPVLRAAGELVRSTVAGAEGQPGAARRLDFVIAICSTGLDPCTAFDP
jgi:hypothetical protein